jgi:hypothetical protein
MNNTTIKRRKLQRHKRNKRRMDKFEEFLHSEKKASGLSWSAYWQWREGGDK